MISKSYLKICHFFHKSATMSTDKTDTVAKKKHPAVEVSEASVASTYPTKTTRSSVVVSTDKKEIKEKGALSARVRKPAKNMNQVKLQQQPFLLSRKQQNPSHSLLVQPETLNL